MTEQHRNIFIGGLSGAGKTFTGDMLAEKHGYHHFDIEPLHKDQAEIAAFLRDPEERIRTLPEPLVMTWGITEGSLGAARFFLANYHCFWLKGSLGNLALARKQRGNGWPSNGVFRLWEQQQGVYDQTSGWIPVDAFDLDGNRRDLCPELLEEVERRIRG